MNYLLKRACLYNSYLNIVDSTLDKGKTFGLISKTFCLSNEEKEKMEELFSNEQFNKLSSRRMLKIHLMAVDTFCKDKGMFGDNVEEKELLKLKLKAYEVVNSFGEELADDYLTITERYKERNDFFATSFVFLSILKNDEINEKDKSLLRKIIKREEFAIDGRLLLIEYENDKNNLLSQLFNSDAMRIKTEEAKRIAKYYGVDLDELKKEATANELLGG